MRKLLVIAAVAILLFIPVVMPGSDAEQTKEITARYSNNQLYHFTGVAIESFELKYNDNTWVYEYGKDTSMKEYINDHSRVPSGGLSSVREGRTYEVYYVGTDNISYYFEYAEKKMVLGEYRQNCDFYVEERTIMRIKVTNIHIETNSQQDDPNRYNIIKVQDGKTSSRYCYLDETYDMNHIDHGFYRIESNTWYCLYTEMQVETTVKEFSGSPYLYIGLCIGITVAVAGLIFFCGRKPKL